MLNDSCGTEFGYELQEGFFRVVADFNPRRPSSSERSNSYRLAVQ